MKIRKLKIHAFIWKILDSLQVKESIKNSKNRNSRLILSVGIIFGLILLAIAFVFVYPSMVTSPVGTDSVHISPTLTIYTPIDNSSLLTGANVTIIGSALDNSGTGLRGVWAKLDGGDYNAVIPKTPGDYSSWSFHVVLTKDGLHTITSKAIDNRNTSKATSIVVTGVTHLLYDNFEGPAYSLVDNQTSPNGLWYCDYTGYGVVEASGGVLRMTPAAASATNSDDHNHTTYETTSALILSTSKFRNIWISADVRTVAQIADRPHNPWEVAWLIWNSVDRWHAYYFSQKTNGIEIGKRDNTQRIDRQDFLYTSTSNPVVMGQWYHWDVYVKENHITVYVDHNKVADVYDTTESSYFKNGGRLGLYSEDASVEFDNVQVNSLS